MLFGRHLGKYYKKYWPFFLLGFLALLFTDYAQTEIPGYLEEIVNGLSGDGLAEGRLKEILLAILLLSFLILLGRIAWRLCIFYAARKIEAGLRQDMFEKAEKLPLSFYHENKVGAIMGSFTSDVETVGEYFGWGTVMLVDSVFLTLIVIVRMVRLSWALTLVAAVPILLIAIWGALVEKFSSKLWEQRQSAFDELYSFAEENFTGIRLIKSFVKENQEIHAFAKIAKKNEDANLKFGKTAILFDAIIEAIIACIVALLMGFGGYWIVLTMRGTPLVLFGKEVLLDAGQLTAFISLFDILIWPMIAMGQIVMMHARSKASLGRISRFLDAPEDVASPKDAIPLKEARGEIVFENFSFRYPDAKEDALSHISLTVHPGEKVGIVGRVGSGKSSLLKALLRLYNYQEGTLFLNGVDLMKADLASLRDSIAYSPQDSFLFSDTLENNIAFSKENSDPVGVEKASTLACLDKDVKDFKDGYQTVLGERGVTLSGGQRQRASLARAYEKDAPILLLDDTVSAVDLQTEAEILKNLFEARKGKTTLMVASRVSSVRNFDRIIVMKNGTVEAFGTHEELLSTSPTYQKMVELQHLQDQVEAGR